MVDFSSANTLSRISWQPVQNFSVLVSSSAVLKPPQKITPATKPASTSTPSPNTELGRRSTSHSSTHEAQTAPHEPRVARRLSAVVVIAGHPGLRAAQQRVDVDEIVGDRRRHHVSAARGTAVQKKRRGDTEARNWPSRSMKWVIETIGACDFAGARARVAGQAFVAVDVDLIAVDRMRDHRRLLGIVARSPVSEVLRIGVIGGAGPSSLSGVGPRRPELTVCAGSEPIAGGDRRTASRGCQIFRSWLAHTRSMRTAHFLKSVCSEIGSVASSVTLLMSWLSSNHGTNTSPRGGLLRPRVSTRVRMIAAARLHLHLVAAPQLAASAASSGCMKHTASGNAW